jgi:hypothetical protein
MGSARYTPSVGEVGLMLFNLLRLFGLDVPAKIEAAKADLELRVEQATDYVKQVAREAAMIAAFYLVATIAAASAAGIGLMAIYRWMTDDYGPYIGLATDGALLLAFAAVCAGLALIKSHSMVGIGSKPRVRLVGQSTAIAAPSQSVTAAPTATVADLAEPLSAILSTHLTSAGTGNPMVNELLGQLGTTARSTADEALDRAAQVVRYGDRASVIAVLVGAAAIGWVLSPLPSSRHAVSD